MGNSSALPICEMYMNTSSPGGNTSAANNYEVRTAAVTVATTSTPFLVPNEGYFHDNNHSSYPADSEARAEVTSSSFTWIEVVISILCLLGIVGNILNLLVLSHRRMASDRIGRSMNVGLVSLAISDMLFCLVVFPYTFVPKDLVPTTGAASFKLVYRIYGVACINVFMMSSTWIVMFMSVSRYLGVVYPLKAKSSICTQKMPIIILMVYVLSILVTLPYFMHMSVLPCTDGTRRLYELRTAFSEDTSEKLVYYIRWVWPIIADFFPLLLLVVCNTRLIVELHRTSKSRKATCPGQTVRATSNRVTITLIAVVLMLFIFVSPSEILKYIDPYKSWGMAGHIVATVTNIMQLVNFSSNFILYCAINPKFRSAAKGLVLDICCPWKRSHRTISDGSSKDKTSGHWKSSYSTRTSALGNYKQVTNTSSSM